MDKLIRRRALAQVAAIAVAAGSGLIEPARSLSRIPEEIIVELVDDEEDETRLPRTLLPLLAKDARASVRERVAVAAAALAPRAPIDAEKLVRELCGDPESGVRGAAARSLSSLIASSPPLVRLEIVGRWALSPRVHERAAIARALRSRTPVFVSDLALETLSTDDDAEVRALAARAMAHRLAEAPAAYGVALERLARDGDPRVVRTARRLRNALSAARRPA